MKFGRLFGGAPAAAPAPGVRTAAVRTRHPSELRVLGVLDTMSATCFGAECDLALPTPGEWQDALRDFAPDLVFVESAWQGNGGTWQYMVGSYARDDVRGLPQLSALTAAAREAGIPTVFWNKEDPVHFDKFKEAAALFDVVFTTDADMVPKYEALGGAIRHVDALQFAAQPSLHHPTTGGVPRESSPVFAGTFYRNRHEDRQAPMVMLLEAAEPFGLVIYDRMHGSDSADFGFPDSVAHRVVGSLPYDEVVRTYRHHKVFLNVNSVTGSPTMFSRRVFELLACGTPVVSTPSAGMSALFGDLVAVVETPEDATAAIKRLVEDDAYWKQVSDAGVERVMSAHTYAHRLAAVARAAGLDVEVGDPTQQVVIGDATMVREVAATSAADWIVPASGVAQDPDDLRALLTAARYARADVIGLGGRHAYVDHLPEGVPVAIRRRAAAERGWPAPGTVEATTRTWFQEEGLTFYSA